MAVALVKNRRNNMRVELLSQADEKRAIRLAQRLERIDFLLIRHGGDKDHEPDAVRIPLLTREKRRRALELELLDLRCQELEESGAEPQPRDDKGGASLSDATDATGAVVAS